MIRSIALTAVATTAITTGAQADIVVSNGDFASAFTSTDGSVDTSTPGVWLGGLAGGSNYGWDHNSTSEAARVSNGGSGYRHLVQFIDLDTNPGGDYTLTFNVSALLQAGIGGNFGASVWSSTDASASGNMDLSKGSLETPDDFTEIATLDFGSSVTAGVKTLDFTLTNADQWLAIQFEAFSFGGGTTGAVLEVDDVAVIPEPASLVLLGLGGLLMLGRGQRTLA